MDNEFEIYLLRLGLSAHTILNAKQQVRSFLSYQNEFSQQAFHSFLAHLRERGFSNATLNKYIQAIRLYGRFLGEEWVHEEKQLVEHPKIPNTLSDEEMERFLEVPKRRLQSKENYQKWQVFWSLAFFCGMRLKEIRTLTTDQIDLGKSLIVLNKTKTVPRTVSIPHPIVLVLDKYLQSLEGHILFPSPKNVTVCIKENGYVNDFRLRIKSIGIKRNIKPYDMRHTSITRWLKKLKMTIFDVKRQAGHKHTSTTERYYFYGDQDEITEQLNHDPILQKKKSPQQKFQHLCEKLLQEMGKEACFEYTLSSSSFEVKLKI